MLKRDAAEEVLETFSHKMFSALIGIRGNVKISASLFLKCQPALIPPNTASNARVCR